MILGFCLSVATAEEKGKEKDKNAKEAKITKVDAKKGTVTVELNEKGKEVEKTFKLAEDIEYVDSTGKVASVDIFTSGDLVLLVEREGKICKMKKKDKTDSVKKPESK
jgi:hypothetical protein